MFARAQFSQNDLSDTELFAKIQLELVNRYGIEGRLASEMAWDLFEVVSAIDGDIDIFEKYFLHQ